MDAFTIQKLIAVLIVNIIFIVLITMDVIGEWIKNRESVVSLDFRGWLSDKRYGIIQNVIILILYSIINYIMIKNII